MRRRLEARSRGRHSSWLSGAVVLAALLGGGQPAVADSVLGNDGELYELVAAPVGDQPALALKILRPGEPERVLAVPGTEDAGAEDWESLIFEHESGSVYAFWRSRDGGQSVLKIAGLRDGVWTEPLAVAGDPAATKLSPQMLVTHE